MKPKWYLRGHLTGCFPLRWRTSSTSVISSCPEFNFTPIWTIGEDQTFAGNHKIWSLHRRHCWRQTCWGGHRWCRACWPHTPSWRLPSVRIPSEKNQDAMNGKSVWQNHFKTQQGHNIVTSEDLKRRKILLSQRRNKVASLGRWLCGLQADNLGCVWVH